MDWEQWQGFQKDQELIDPTAHWSNILKQTREKQNKGVGKGSAKCAGKHQRWGPGCVGNVSPVLPHVEIHGGSGGNLLNRRAEQRRRKQLIAGSWNTKGSAEKNLVSICNIMKMYRIEIMCLQETWASNVEYYIEEGFQVILPGSEKVGRSWAGLGFVVAPWSKHLAHGFLLYSDRLVYLTIYVCGRRMGLVVAYAPHNLKQHTW